MADTRALSETCGLCGTAKAVGEDRTRAASGEDDGVDNGSFAPCSNPDCPGNESDLAKAADRQ